ncbi:hypothetical protein BESB_036720 [Besnoitia besnoiti]|uniref:Uncharacterized protein n=1 Tax=Besnoitia besnoiti TaxID=94643 RepID=A0A2A9MJ43_BESBE|nr:hypothetical protein BESB_036720 [Besnoitia besnoiti]PFH37214.1 hypothetical protein BESB_036720 [Besnoitia besnoiti]
MASGDVNIHTDKEIPPVLKSAIGEPKKTGYKFPHILFPYKSRYRSPHRQRWWPGSVPRFPLHSHPKRWASRHELSFAFFAFHGLKSGAERNLYELMHSLPLRGASSWFWREADADPWKHAGRKASRLQARGVRTVDTPEEVESAEQEACSAEVPGHTQDETSTGAEVCRRRLPKAARKQLIFSPNEIYYKHRPFKALVFGRLSVAQLGVAAPAGGLEPGASQTSSSDSASGGERAEGNREAQLARYLKHPLLISGRSRVAPPHASLGGWRWTPPADASRWVFRPKFPLPCRPDLFEPDAEEHAGRA